MAERSKLRILVVDDDPSIIKLLGTVITAAGYPSPDTAVSGEAALRSATRADIVLLDHELPDMTGVEVLERLSRLASPPTVILITGRGDESVAAAALRFGAVDYLVKDETLARLVPKVIERARRTSAIREELVEAERDMVSEERRAALGEVTVTLHHEINNPLMSALAEVELLSQDGLTEGQRDGVLRIKAALERIRDIVRRVAQAKGDATVDYLDGMAMLDLATSAQPVAGIRGRALMLVPQEATARVVKSLLGRAGFKVSRCSDVDQLKRDTGLPGVTLVVVGPGNDLSVEPLDDLPPSGSRGYRVVVLLSDAGGRPADADRVIQLPFDPATFIAEIDSALQMED